MLKCTVSFYKYNMFKCLEINILIKMLNSLFI